MEMSVGQMVGSLDIDSLRILCDAQLDYYGKRVAAASDDCTVSIWDITDGQQKPAGVLKGHEGPVWKVSWAHPRFGSLLATCSYDMKIAIWKETSPNSTNWQIAYMDSSHAASVNDVQFCSQEYGLKLACASSDGTVSILSYDSGAWRRAAFNAHPGGAQSLSWMPVQYREGSIVPVMRLASGGCDGVVNVWRSTDGETWAQEQPLLPAAHSDWVRAVAWRPTAGASMIASGSWDKKVAIYAQEMEGQLWRQVCTLNIPGKVESVSWSVTGSMLAVSFGDSDVALYKEGFDGHYVEVGKVSEAGFAEVPNSLYQPISEGMMSGGAGLGHDPAALGLKQAEPSISNELAEQQQSVLDAFGMS